MLEEESCDGLSPEGSITVLGAAILVLLPLSYVPQYWSILQTSSSQGIDLLSLLLGQFSSFAGAMTALLLHSLQLICCSQGRLQYCGQGILIAHQLLLGWLVQIPLYLLCLFYRQERLRPLLHYCSILFSLLPPIVGLALVLVSTYGPNHRFIHEYASLMSLLANGFTLIRWLPQIYATLRSGSLGQLNPIMLCFHVPGCIAMAWIQAEHGESFFVWSPYLMSAAQMSLLLLIWLWPRFTNVFKCYKNRHGWERLSTQAVVIPS